MSACISMAEGAEAAPRPPSSGQPRASGWSRWRARFEHNVGRPLPTLLARAPEAGAASLSPAQARALAWSLARFQLGETGEGRIVRDVARSRMPGIDDDYRRALTLFVKEEGRHARILAIIVRGLGGQLVGSTWSARAFVIVRRLLGIRCKLLAMFAAEVIGIGCYGALAAALPRGGIRQALQQIAGDERAHLAFHRQFFAVQAGRGWRRALFLLAWYPLASAAALAVLWEHRRTLRALGIPARALRARLRALIAQGAS